jgi:hypothetical protein
MIVAMTRCASQRSCTVTRFKLWRSEVAFFLQLFAGKTLKRNPVPQRKHVASQFQSQTFKLFMEILAALLRERKEIHKYTMSAKRTAILVAKQGTHPTITVNFASPHKNFEEEH